MSVGTHKRYCQGVASQEKKHICKYCTFSSNTETGLKIHVSQAPPEKQSVTLKGKKVFAWAMAQWAMNFLQNKSSN